MPEHGTGSSQSNPSCRQSFPTRGLQAAPVHHQNFILNCAAYSISLIQLVLERSLKQDSNCYSIHIPMWTLVLWVSRRIGWWNLCGRINPFKNCLLHKKSLFVQYKENSVWKTSSFSKKQSGICSLCYYGMFCKCAKLNYVKAMFTDYLSAGTTRDWLTGVSYKGTFVKSYDAHWNMKECGIPKSWDLERN